MRKFKLKSGKFTFEILTDDHNVVVAKLNPKTDVEYVEFDDHVVGRSIRKENDKFDLHLGMHIAIRNCLNNLKSVIMNSVTGLLRHMESDMNGVQYYNRDTFVEFRKRRLAKIERSKKNKNIMIADENSYLTNTLKQEAK